MTDLKETENPIPQGKYVPALRVGNLIYTAGMTSRRKGVLIQIGKVMPELPISTYKEAVEQATSNALTAAKNTLAIDESLGQIVSLTVYVNAEETFREHSGLADFASEYLYEKLGESAIGARAAIGVSSLPGNAPVEIQMVAVVSKKSL
jgi:enamine deaminase RidA (YjgF/YER057c/UK114 family)